MILVLIGCNEKDTNVLQQFQLTSCDLLIIDSFNNVSTQISDLDQTLYSTHDDDNGIRELGNLIIDSRLEGDTAKYKLFFSEYIGEYEQNNVFIRYIYSSDNIIWKEKIGNIINRPLEDPYVVLYDNIYYLFAEDKLEVPFRSIRRYHSFDCDVWVDDGIVLDLNEGNYYENRDVSSPVVFIKDSLWLMFYEGRGEDWSGSINLATSSDGLNWIKEHKYNPLYKPGQIEMEWDFGSSVPDDIFIINDEYYLIYHALGQQNKWYIGILTSNNLYNWFKINTNPFISLMELMVSIRPAGHFLYYIMEKNYIKVIEIEEIYCE